MYSLKVSFVTLSFQKVFLVLFSQFSTALLIPSGFSDRGFKTAPDLSFSTRSKTVLAKWKWTGNQRCRMATNKAFKADSQRWPFLVFFEFSVYGTMV